MFLPFLTALKKGACYSMLAILVAGVSILSPQVAPAQSSLIPVKKLGLYAGPHQAVYKDLNFSPLNYSAQGLGIALTYQYESPKTLFATNLNFSGSTLSTSGIGHFDSQRYIVNLGVSYLKSLSRSSRNILYAGLQLHSYFDLANYDELEAVSYLILHTLDIQGVFVHNLRPRHQLQYAVAIPIFGFLARPPYTGWDKSISDDSPAKVITQGKWTSLNDFVSINPSISYHFRVNEKISLSAKFDLQYQKTDHLKTLKSLTFQQSAGLLIHL